MLRIPQEETAPPVKFRGFPGVIRERSRHGKMVYYYRHRKGPRVRINGEPNSQEFALSYAAAVANYTARRASRAIDYEIAPAANALARSLQGAKLRAHKRGLPFDLDVDWCIETLRAQDGVCAVTGMKFECRPIGSSGRAPLGPSFDRIDPAKGYTRENTRIVVLAVNVMLLDWGEGMFRRVAWHYARHRARQRIPPD